MARRRSVRAALDADLATLDGTLAGKEALVAAAFIVAGHVDVVGAETSDVVAASAELRRLFEALGAKEVADGLDSLLAEFGQAAMGDPPNP